MPKLKDWLTSVEYAVAKTRQLRGVHRFIIEYEDTQGRAYLIYNNPIYDGCGVALFVLVPYDGSPAHWDIFRLLGDDEVGLYGPQYETLLCGMYKRES